MKSTKRIVILLILAVLVTSPVRSAQISNTRTASCLVKVTCDPAIIPLNLETIDYLLQSSGVGGRARREVLGISPGQDIDLFNIEYVQLSASEISTSWRRSRGTPSASSKADDGMSEYEYAVMMEMNKEYGQYDSLMMKTEATVQAPSAGTSSRSRSSSRRSRTGSGYDPASSVSSSRRSRDRGSSSYGYFPALPAPQQRSRTTISDSTDEQMYLFRLNIHLPEDVKPLAREFMKALVDNLRESLVETHNIYSNDLEASLEDAEARRDRARSRLADAMEQIKAVAPPPEIIQNPADAAVYERLEQIVDLSILEPSMLFVEVITELKNSVDPPLQIQPNWRDLLENAEVEQTTPAGVDPLTGIKLRKALEILLSSVSNDFAELKYVVDEGVILIATQDRLPSKLETRVYEISALSYSAGGAKDLIDAIQNTIEPESWFDLSDTGEGSITPYPSRQPRKLAIFQTYENHQKIQEFLQTITIDIPVGTPLDIPVEMLLSEKNDLLREKQNLEMELARLQGRMPAIEKQIVRIKEEIDEKVQADQVSEELRKILDMQVKRLEGFKKLVDDGDINGGVADAEEKLARAKIELARRREQIGASAGTDQLAKYSNELAALTIDQAEKKAMLDVVKNQLDQTEQQLTAGDISDPQISRIRMAMQAIEIAERRANELNARLLNLQLPWVSVLGGE